MNNSTETKRYVKVTDILPGELPAILTSETAPGPSGRPRLFTQKIQVRDAELWEQVVSEVQKGDTLWITVKTIWLEEGRYYTCLGDFAKVEVPAEAPALAGAAA